MEKMSEAYDEIFLNSDARAIIPAVRYLLTMCKVRDEATAYFERLNDADYPVYISEKIVPEIVIDMAKDLQAACYAEVYSAECRVRETLKVGLEKTFVKQMDLLGGSIELDSSELSELIRRLEDHEYVDPYKASDEEMLAIIISDMSYVVWYMNSYYGEYCEMVDKHFDDNPYLFLEDDDNVLPTKSDIMDTIVTVEEYLADLKKRLDEFEKEESKNIDKNAEYEEK